MLRLAFLLDTKLVRLPPNCSGRMCSEELDLCRASGM